MCNCLSFCLALIRSDMDRSMNSIELDDMRVQAMGEQSMEGSFTLGEIMEQKSSSSIIPTGAPEEITPSIQESLFSGLIGKVKSKLGKEDDQDNFINNDMDVSQQNSLGSMGESGQLSMSTAQQSSQNLAGAFFLQTKPTRYVLLAVFVCGKGLRLSLITSSFSRLSANWSCKQ